MTFLFVECLSCVVRRRRSHRASQIAAFVAVLCLAGCGGSQGSSPLSAQEQQELEKLRAENQETKKLSAQNQELERLRKDNQDLQKLRAFGQEILRLRLENEQLRSKLAALPASKALAETETLAPEPLKPIQDLPQAFAEAALVVAADGNVRPEDVPQKGDNILIDQSVIGLLIPEFQKNTNGGPYEVSGWLAAKGVLLTNYQQLNVLGLTNYFIRRAPPAAADSQAK